MPAALCALLTALVALSAAANSHYSETSLSGNLQTQCTAFTGTLRANTSVTVAAECNKEDADAPGTVESARESTSINLSDDVVWNASSRTFTWDGTVTNDNDIDKLCAVQGFSYSSSDVTLGLNCIVAMVDGGCPSDTVPVRRDPTGPISECWYMGSLPLNAELTVDTDGELERR